VTRPKPPRRATRILYKDGIRCPACKLWGWWHVEMGRDEQSKDYTEVLCPSCAVERHGQYRVYTQIERTP